MSPLENLINLARTGDLKPEPPDRRECEGLLQSARDRLQDANNTALSFASRFDLAYNAAHALALTALRLRGYRSERRYLVFQCLTHTLSLPALQVRLLVLCHERRNLAEYEGYMDIDDALLAELLGIANDVLPEVERVLNNVRF